MKVASIDIGTNSMRLLVADYEKDEIVSKEKYINTTQIGRGKDRYGKLSKEAILENANALKEFVDMAHEKGAKKIIARGTSALRDSTNKEEFIELAKKVAGIEVEIISGDMEAMYGFYGVKSMLDANRYNLIVDIGGGSTEFIVGDLEEEIVFSKSINIGALRLTQEFIQNNPPTKRELEDMDKHIFLMLTDVIETVKKYSIKKLISIGGTATSISSMVQGLKIYDSTLVHNSIVTMDEMEDLYKKINCITTEQRQILTGLSLKRSDVIVAGINIMQKIMQMLEFDKAYISDFDNLEGMVYKMM